MIVIKGIKGQIVQLENVITSVHYKVYVTVRKECVIVIQGILEVTVQSRGV